MYNSTSTASGDYNKSSKLQEIEEEGRDQVEIQRKEIDKNAFDFGYLYSIVLKREEIIKELISCFEINNTAEEELDFLAINLDILELLPSIGLYIKSSFDSKAKLSLELLSEATDWQTLFINIQTKSNWIAADTFVNNFFDNLFEEFPLIADKLNVNIIPNEL